MSDDNSHPDIGRKAVQPQGHRNSPFWLPSGWLADGEAEGLLENPFSSFSPIPFSHFLLEYPTIIRDLLLVVSFGIDLAEIRLISPSAGFTARKPPGALGRAFSPAARAKGDGAMEKVHNS